MLFVAWWGPWEWPAWPAFAVILAVFGSHGNFAELPYGQRAAFIVLLMFINVAAWAGVAYGISHLARWLWSRSQTGVTTS